MVNNIEIFRGDDEAIIVNVTGSGGSVDITGYTFFFTVKDNESDGDASALIAIDVSSHNDPTNGQTIIDIPAGSTNIDSGVYYYDIQMKDTSSSITTLLKGEFIVVKDISTRTS